MNNNVPRDTRFKTKREERIFYAWAHRRYVKLLRELFIPAEARALCELKFGSRKMRRYRRSVTEQRTDDFADIMAECGNNFERAMRVFESRILGSVDEITWERFKREYPFRYRYA